MKLTVVMLTVTLLHASAADLAQEVSINVKKVSIVEVLEKIQSQTSYNFLYNPRDLRNTKPVSLSGKDMSLREALDKCFRGQPVNYHIGNTTVLISQKPSVPAIQREMKKVITGKITDEKGGALPGVSVKIKGTNLGAVSANDGTFTISVDNADVILVFSFIGFEPQERKAGSGSSMNIVLKALTTGLSEVVVVGYGSQKKSDITGSIASVNESAIKSVPTGNLMSALQGQAAGIDIQKSNGNSHPGAAPNIMIRGQRSLGASNSPLYIVDGVPFNEAYITDLNQDDVTSVQILKDASATAIYGSRGANGVVLITTRRGKTGKPVVTYSAYAGTTRPIDTYDMMDGKKFEVYKKWAMFNSTISSDPTKPNAYTSIDDPKMYTDGLTFLPAELTAVESGTSTDWQTLIYKNGFKTDHQLGVSGGTENTQYAISGGFYDETGIFVGQSFRRYSLKLSIDQKLGKIFKIGVSTINAVSATNGESINPFGQALRSSPLTVPYDANGNLIAFPNGGSGVYNPLANLVPGAVVQNRNRFNTFTTAYVEAEFLPHLKYRFNGGVQLTPEIYGDFYGSATYQNLNGPSSATNNSYNYHNYTLENMLIYDNTFSDKHHVNFTGLFSFQDDYKVNNSFKYTSILADYVQYYNPVYGSNLSGTGKYDKYDIVSFMGRVNYDFKGKYLLTATVRSDGASRLAPGNKYHVFPSAAAGWNVDQEEFIRKFDFLSALKLRAGYGSVGNSAVNPYQTLGGLGTYYYNYGSTNVIGTFPNNVPNPKLTWEKTTTVNLGLDFGLFKNRISGNIDAYHSYTSDLLLAQNLPITTGYTQQFYANVGKTENRGLEIAVATENFRSTGRNELGWTTGINVTFNRNKITALANGVIADVGNTRFVGSAIGSIYNYKRLGIWQNTAADSAEAKRLGLTVNGPSSVIGNIRVADINGDNKINADDRTIIGKRDPDFSGGITNRLTFKGFDFTVVASYRVGGTLVASQFNGGNLNALAGKDGNLDVNYWTPYNHENFYPKPNRANNGVPPYDALLTYFDASYLKIRTLSLGYNLTPSVLSRLKAKSLRVYATANDAFILFSPFVNKYHGIDPESSGNLGVDVPSTYSILFGLNVSF